VHAPTPLAPPRRRRPVVVTVHDAVPWTHPETLTPRGVRWHRAMIERAGHEADAIVVPTRAVADELARRVPMDVETARDEAAMFATEPGQAISYQVGKLQILGFLSDARAARADDFDLRQFHDALWVDGNVPIALQRWQALNTADEVKLLPL
jgi:hypothetical protein